MDVLLPFHCVSFYCLHMKGTCKRTGIMIKRRAVFFFSAIAITFYWKADDCLISPSPIKNLDYGTKALFQSLIFASLFHHSMSWAKRVAYL